jgi:quercetin dioxygenase-like cupin family protein
LKRIICGVGENGQNTVLFEGPPHVVERASQRPEGSLKAPSEVVYLGWAASPPDSGTEDEAAAIEDFHFKLNPGEVLFLRVEIAPGAASPVHRTPHVNDYLVAISGELTMYTEDGKSATFSAGDMLVQLAGWHSWRNESDEPFVMAGTIIGIETDEDAPRGVQLAAGLS